MATITFDTLAYSDSMQKAGFTREQADAMARANSEAFNRLIDSQQFATKQDVANARHELEVALATVKHEILKWMVTAMIAQTALLVGIIAFLK